MAEIELKAHEAWEAGHFKLARELFIQGATQGSRGCMLDLGYFYDEGIGTATDKQQAMHWYKKAYRLGSGEAASNIAILYREQGRINYAARWFQRAAQLNDGDAEVELAKLLIEGKGIRRSVSIAKACLLRAISSTSITSASKEEAEELFAKVQDGL